MTIRYFEDKGINPPKPREVLALGFTYPGLPPREMSPNGRVHWSARNRARRDIQGDIWALILEQEYTSGIIENPIISIRWGLPDRIRRDWDNLIAMTKPIIDSLTQASILADDSVRDYTPRYAWFDSPKKPLTEIKVYRVEYDN
jgi:Holliday junction resolvase RusA-like endonuclease